MLKRIFKKLLRWIIILAAIIAVGFLLPENVKMPVQGAVKADYNKDSFWYYPWGKSVTHKGVDIFARKGNPIHSSVGGFVVYKGHLKYGGNVVLVLGPKWKLHYYAHLDSIKTGMLNYVSQTTEIGTVGDSGNASGNPPHLHYSIISILPYPWLADDSRQGWKKMFFMNPIRAIEGN